MSRGNGSGDGRLPLLGAVLETLAGEVGGAALGGLDDDGGLGVPCGLEGGGGGGRGGHVDGRDREAMALCVLEQLQHVIAVDDAGLDVELLEKTGHCDGDGGTENTAIWLCCVWFYLREGQSDLSSGRRYKRDIGGVFKTKFQFEDFA